jgi:hypothetical protein
MAASFDEAPLNRSGGLSLLEANVTAGVATLVSKSVLPILEMPSHPAAAARVRDGNLRLMNYADELANALSGDFQMHCQLRLDAACRRRPCLPHLKLSSFVCS